MAHGILGIVWLIIFSVSGLVAIVYLRRYKNQERMAAIDKGISPADERYHNNAGTLKFALLLIGGGLGLFLGYFLDEMFYMEEVGYFAMLFIFGGIGLVMAYVIEEKKAKQNE